MTDYKALYDAECKHDRDERAKVAALEAEVRSLWSRNEELEQAIKNSDTIRALQHRALDQQATNAGKLEAQVARLLSALKEAREGGYAEKFEEWKTASEVVGCGLPLDDQRYLAYRAGWETALDAILAKCMLYGFPRCAL